MNPLRFRWVRSTKCPHCGLMPPLAAHCSAARPQKHVGRQMVKKSICYTKHGAGPTVSRGASVGERKMGRYTEMREQIGETRKQRISELEAMARMRRHTPVAGKEGASIAAHCAHLVAQTGLLPCACRAA